MVDGTVVDFNHYSQDAAKDGSRSVLACQRLLRIMVNGKIYCIAITMII